MVLKGVSVHKKKGKKKEHLTIFFCMERGPNTICVLLLSLVSRLVDAKFLDFIKEISVVFISLSLLCMRVCVYIQLLC